MEKRYQYSGKSISKLLENKIASLYIDMPASSSNGNIVIDDILSPDAGDDSNNKLTRKDGIQRRKHIKSIQQFVKTFFDKIKGKNHDVQIVFKITGNSVNGEPKTYEYITPVFSVYGGHYRLKKAIQKNKKI